MFSIVHAATIALLLTLGQSIGQPFAGIWTSEYGGRLLARLELQGADGALTGRISIGTFHVDSEGKLDQVLEDATNFTAIFDVRIAANDHIEMIYEAPRVKHRGLRQESR